MSRGILTIATGRPCFIEMAIDMALSYREFHEDPIGCIVDVATASIIDSQFPDVFDQVIQIPPAFDSGRLRKFCVAEVSPFEQTLFLDADIIVLNSLERLWQESRESSLMMIGELLASQENRIHHGFSTSELIRHFEIDHYLKTNSGCFAFNIERARPIFSECAATFRSLQQSPLKDRGWLGDEIAFGMVGGQGGIDVFDAPSPMLWQEEMAALRPGDSTTPLCHFISPIPPRTFSWIERGIVKRRQAMGLPTQGSRCWRELNRENTRNLRPPSLFQRFRSKMTRLFPSS